MAWNGLGTFNLNPLYSPEVNGTVIDAVRYNGLTTDIAAGITVALTKDGQNIPTANLPMGGFKHTGAGAGAGAGQYTVYGQTAANFASLFMGATTGTGELLGVTVADGSVAARLIADTGMMRFRPYVDATNGAVIDANNLAQTLLSPITITASNTRLVADAAVSLINASGPTFTLTTTRANYSGAAELRLNRDNTYLSGYRTDGTTRSGVLAFNTSDVTLAADLGPILFQTPSVVRFTSPTGSVNLYPATNKLGVGRVPAAYALEVEGDTFTSGYFRGDGSLLTNLPSGGAVTWMSIAGKPTTIAGFGITDAPTVTGIGATGTWSISITGNAATATSATSAASATTATTAGALTNPTTINGVSFNGASPIVVTAAASTLTGSTLAAGVTASSLTSFGTLVSLNVSGAVNAGSFVGPLTGTVTGNVTGSAGSTTGNAATATALQSAQTINGVSFNGTAPIVVTAAAGTLTGATLAAGVTASSLTSVGTLGSLGVTGTVTAGAFSGPLTGPLTGNVTGNVTGNASGSAGSVAAANITGVTLAAGVTASSLTSVGTLGSLTVSGAATLGSASTVNSQTIGYRGLPSASVTTGSFVAGDAGKCVYATAGVTVPNSTMAATDAVTILNTTGSAITLTATVGTLRLAGTASTGNRTLGAYGLCTVVFVSPTLAFISGAGVA